MKAEDVKKTLKKAGHPEKVAEYARFFKTGKGQYGEGDFFLGITMPEQRRIAKQYKTLELEEIEKLLSSKYHEARMTALLILTLKYEEEEEEKEQYYTFYINNAKKINNWDLVDVTAPKIVGDYLLNKNRKVLYKLAKSKNLWEKRISIVSTYHFIKNNDYGDTLQLAEILHRDKHDLIHKAVGWMLREVGKRDQAVEEKFLRKYHKKMPRTMLRYAIEKFSEKKRKRYMKK